MTDGRNHFVPTFPWNKTH